GIQFLGGDKLVSWSSKKQDCTSMSFAEAKYVSLSACCAQVQWMRTQLTDYGFHFDKLHMYCDSKATIAISCNPVQHSRTKHIGNGYSRNGQKPGEKRQNQTQNGKDRKRRSKSKPKDKSQTFGQQKSTLKVKVNPGNVKVNPDKKTEG
nr:uncharacterized mitochondrial protein AtMg00810-like [Tanacetum cinerariifolium]